MQNRGLIDHQSYPLPFEQRRNLIQPFCAQYNLGTLLRDGHPDKAKHKANK